MCDCEENLLNNKEKMGLGMQIVSLYFGCTTGQSESAENQSKSTGQVAW